MPENSILNLVLAIAALAALVILTIIIPGKLFIRSIKDEKGFRKVLWIALMLVTWPIANFIYGIYKPLKPSTRIWCVIFLIASLAALAYVYQNFDTYLAEAEKVLSGQAV